MQLNAFQPIVIVAPATITGAAQTISPTYPVNGPQLTSYRIVVSPAATAQVGFLFGATPTITANNSFYMNPGTTEVVTGPPNSVLQAFGLAAAGTVQVSVGEGL